MDATRTLSERNIGTSGGALHLYEWMPSERSGTEAVALLLHGGPGLWFNLDDLVPLLPPTHTVIGYDQRGCGHSTGTGPYSLDQQVADVDTVRAASGAETVCILGHSAGANLALAYAMTFPHRVRSLTYLSGTGIGDWRPDYRSERERRLGPERLARLRELGQLATRNPAQEREFRLLSWCTDYSDVETGLALAEHDADATFAINVDANKSIGDPDFSQLSAIEVPIAVVHGEADPRPYWSAKMLADALPSATFTLIPNAGHNPWRENPDATRAALLI
ncbi:alpha/beta fold hydrolase [Haematomicrobium sanguinis]|uniref:alpha/beta fold hydrolase n=1 Tax=Haematomicrobium sanguinis TaxID=479106 RepID=UPI0006914794|nr:alpha/beta hydrolase [Haematomicrobium sanguinis]